MEIDLDEANLNLLGLQMKMKCGCGGVIAGVMPSTLTHTFHTINAKNFQLLQHTSHHKATACEYQHIQADFMFHIHLKLYHSQYKSNSYGWYLMVELIRLTCFV